MSVCCVCLCVLFMGCGHVYICMRIYGMWACVHMYVYLWDVGMCASMFHASCLFVVLGVSPKSLAKFLSALCAGLHFQCKTQSTPTFHVSLIWWIT